MKFLFNDQYLAKYDSIPACIQKQIQERLIKKGHDADAIKEMVDEDMDDILERQLKLYTKRKVKAKAYAAEKRKSQAPAPAPAPAPTPAPAPAPSPTPAPAPRTAQMIVPKEVYQIDDETEEEDEEEDEEYEEVYEEEEEEEEEAEEMEQAAETNEKIEPLSDPINYFRAGLLTFI